MHVIYLINQENTNLYKIGVTKNLDKRLKTLQTSNPTKLIVIKKFNTRFGYKLEKKIHLLFSNYQLQGEWFQLETQQVNRFDDYCRKAEESFNYLKEHNTYIQFL